MSRSKFLAGQVRRSVIGGAWHGPAVLEIVKGVSARQAAQRPLNTHSIWELLLHIDAWQQITLRRLQGEVFSAQPDSKEDWPPVGSATEAAWRKACASVKRSNQRLAAAAAKCSDKRLVALAGGQRYTNEFMLDGVVQHNIYHAGQIALLKKILL